MSSQLQTAVWIDHHEARIFHVKAGTFDEATIHAPPRHIQRHERGGTAEHNHPEDAQRFFHDVAAGLRDGTQILVMGPSTAKLQLLRYLHQHDPAIEQRVVGIETVDHPTDRQIAAYVRRYFELSETPVRPHAHS